MSSSCETQASYSSSKLCDPDLSTEAKQTSLTLLLEGHCYPCAWGKMFKRATEVILLHCPRWPMAPASWLTPSIAGPRFQSTISTVKISRNRHSSNEGVTLVVTPIAMWAQLSCQLWGFLSKAKTDTTTIPGKRWTSFGTHHLRLSSL